MRRFARSRNDEGAGACGQARGRQAALLCGARATERTRPRCGDGAGRSLIRAVGVLLSAEKKRRG